MIIPGLPLHAETQRLVARFSTRDDAHIRDIDLLIRELIWRKLWSKTEVVVAGPDANDSLLPLKSATASCSLYGSPTFSADLGYTSVASGAVRHVESPNAKNNLCFGGYIQSPITSGNLMGVSNDRSPERAYIISVDTAGPSVGVNTNSTFLNNSISYSSPWAGFFCVSLLSYGVGYCRFGGSTHILGSVNVPGYNYGPYGVGGQLNSLSNNITASPGNEFSAWFSGDGLTTTEMTHLETALQNYFTRRGTAV